MLGMRMRRVKAGIMDALVSVTRDSCASVRDSGLRRVVKTAQLCACADDWACDGTSFGTEDVQKDERQGLGIVLGEIIERP